MIERIILTNWQNHEHLDLTLDEINVFVGENDKGKSAIIRAIIWAMFSEWDGKANEHITWGKDFSQVELFIDGHHLIRYKGKSSNYYILDGEELKAFWPDIPEPVKKLVNSIAANVQNQDDPPFWLSLTSGQAALALNEIFHLTAVDEAFSSIGSELRQTKAKQVVIEENLQASRGKVANLAWVEKANKSLKKLGTLEEKISTLHDKIDEMESIIKKLTEAEEVQERISKRIEYAELALEVGQDLISLQAKMRIIEQVLRLEDSICQLAKTISVKQAKLNELLREQCPLCGRGPT